MQPLQNGLQNRATANPQSASLAKGFHLNGCCKYRILLFEIVTRDSLFAKFIDRHRQREKAEGILIRRIRCAGVPVSRTQISIIDCQRYIVGWNSGALTCGKSPPWNIAAMDVRCESQICETITNRHCTKLQIPDRLALYAPHYLRKAQTSQISFRTVHFYANRITLISKTI